jgi:mannose-6-phosphate isomerase
MRTMARSARATSPLPIRVEPIFDPKPWGARRLATLCGELPDGLIGEALLTISNARASSGPEAGQTLGDLVASSPQHWCGEQGLRSTRGQALFPLLIKLIDASDTLSVQVHPDDELAAARGLGFGKTEAWHILDAAPGAVVYAGLRPGVQSEEFQAACREQEDVSSYLNAIQVRPGMSVVIPAGVVHAIGGGLLIYEIQQPSNVTFRLNDWGRLGNDGAPRELHHEDGRAALKPHLYPQPVTPLRLDDERAVLAATPYFALEHVDVPSFRALTLPPVRSPQVLTVLHGVVEASLRGVPGSVVARAGETWIAPADAVITLVAGTEATLLRGWVPDLERDIVAPARAAGVADDLLAQVGLETVYS